MEGRIHIPHIILLHRAETKLQQLMNKHSLCETDQRTLFDIAIDMCDEYRTLRESVITHNNTLDRVCKHNKLKDQLKNRTNTPTKRVPNIESRSVSPHHMSNTAHLERTTPPPSRRSGMYHSPDLEQRGMQQT